MSTFQLNVKNINEAESEIKFIVITLSEIQQQLDSQISRLDSCFLCNANYDIKNRLTSVSSNQIASVSDNLSLLASTLEDILAVTDEYEKKAATDSSLSYILGSIYDFFPKEFATCVTQSYENTGTLILDSFSVIFGIYSKEAKFAKMLSKVPVLGYISSVMGDIGSACSAIADDWRRFASDGNMSNRDNLKLTADSAINLYTEVEGTILSVGTQALVTMAVSGCSGGILAPISPAVGTIASKGVSLFYDNIVKGPLSDGLKYVTENTIDFIGDNHVIEKYIDMKVNTVETGGDIIKNVINKGGDGIQAFASDMGHAFLGDGYDNIDRGIDNVQQTITNGVDTMVDSVHNVGDVIKGFVQSIFSN